MAWYKLNLPVRADELDGKLDQYRGMVEQAVARFGGRGTTARVWGVEDAGTMRIYLEIEGPQPSWFVLKLIRCETIPEPPRAGLTLLGEVGADGGAAVRDPLSRA